MNAHLSSHGPDLSLKTNLLPGQTPPGYPTCRLNSISSRAAQLKRDFPSANTKSKSTYFILSTKLCTKFGAVSDLWYSCIFTYLKISGFPKIYDQSNCFQKSIHQHKATYVPSHEPWGGKPWIPFSSTVPTEVPKLLENW